MQGEKEQKRPPAWGWGWEARGRVRGRAPSPAPGHPRAQPPAAGVPLPRALWPGPQRRGNAAWPLQEWVLGDTPVCEAWTPRPRLWAPRTAKPSGHEELRPQSGGAGRAHEEGAACTKSTTSPPGPPAGTATPTPTGGRGLGPGWSLRTAAAGALSPEQLQPQGAAWGGGCCQRKLEASATGGASGASPRLRDDGRGREPLPACHRPQTGTGPGPSQIPPAGQGRGSQAGGGERLGRGGARGQPSKVPEAWSSQPRQGGLGSEPELRSSWRAQGHLGEPSPCVHSRGGPTGQGRSPGAELSRRRAHAGRRALENRQTTRESGASGPEQADAESGAQWGGGDRTKHTGLPGQGPPALSPGRAPSSGLTGPGPGPAGVPGAGGICGRRGPSRRGGGKGAGAPWPPWHRPGTRESKASGQGTHWDPLAKHRRSEGRAIPVGSRLPPPAALLSREEAGGPGCQSQQLLQKREKPKASPAPPGSEPTSPPLHPTSSLKGVHSPGLQLVGRGDSAGTGWGQGLTSDFWHALPLTQAGLRGHSPETSDITHLGVEVGQAKGQGPS